MPHLWNSQFHRNPIRVLQISNSLSTYKGCVIRLFNGENVPQKIISEVRKKPQRKRTRVLPPAVSLRHTGASLFFIYSVSYTHLTLPTIYSV